MRARRGPERPYPVGPTVEEIRSNSAIAAADTNDVLREQLDFLIEHAGEGMCGCSSCQRYAGVRAVLMQVFAN